MNSKTLTMLLIIGSALIATPAVAAEGTSEDAPTASCRPTIYSDGSVIVRCSGTPMSGCVWATTATGQGYYVCFAP